MLVSLVFFVLFFIVNASSTTCDNGDVTKLAAWQQELMIPDRNMGAVCFPTTRGTTERKSQALFVLGMKALSNFNYDLCKIIFEELVESDKDFKMGYFGKAMCGSQLLWGVENGGDRLERDDLGGDIHEDNPAEELNRIPLDAGPPDFGYPYCWRV